MSLSPRLIAIQGIGLGALAVALHGFVPISTAVEFVEQPGGGGTSLADWNQKVAQQQRLQIHEEDEIIITTIAQMISSGALG